MKRFFSRFLPPLPLIFPAALSGALLTLCFPPASLWALCFVALVPLTAALVRVKPAPAASFKAGFLCGVVFFVTMLWWIVKLIPTANVTIPWLMTPALILLTLYLALYPAFFFLLFSALTRYRLLSIILAAAPLWVLLELARSAGELAFPWGAMGYALSDNPGWIQSAAIWGLAGLSFVIVSVNVLVAAVFSAKKPATKTACGLLAVAVVCGFWLHGSWTEKNYEIDRSRTLRVAIVQPNVDLAVKWKNEFRDSTFNLIERLATEAAELDVGLILFPETSAPVYIDGREPKYKRRLSTLARTLRTPIYIGFLDHRFDGPDGELNIFNSSGLFGVDGGLDKYDKNHLLPFSEQLPLSHRFRWLRKIPFGQANFQPGPRRPPIRFSAGTFAPLICFESVLPYLCRRATGERAEFFVNITNDGWFGDTPGPIQHAQMCLLRTVENRRYLLRCANAGVSMVVDPTGRVLSKLGLYEGGIIAADVALLNERTFYSRRGDAPIIILSFVLVAVGTITARRPRDDGRPR